MSVKCLGYGANEREFIQMVNVRMRRFVARRMDLSVAGEYCGFFPWRWHREPPQYLREAVNLLRVRQSHCPPEEADAAMTLPRRISVWESGFGYVSFNVVVAGARVDLVQCAMYPPDVAANAYYHVLERSLLAERMTPTYAEMLKEAKPWMRAPAK